jgi:hypothetical protein
VNQISEHILHWYSGLTLFGRIILPLFIVVVGTELICRRVAPQSSFFRAWTAFFKQISEIWTAVILSIVYLVAVGPVAVGMRAFGRDLLDKRSRATSAWRAHSPNPLGPEAAARHQF